MAKSRAREYAGIQKMSIGSVLVWDTGPHSLIYIARDYAEAARAVPAPAQGHFAAPRYFLACHAIELALKAFLALKGQPVVDLIDTLGHDLAKALANAAAAGLAEAVPDLSGAHVEQINRASAPYNDKVFEYPALPVMMRGFADRPDVDVLIDAADTLVAALYPVCAAHTNQ